MHLHYSNGQPFDPSDAVGMLMTRLRVLRAFAEAQRPRLSSEGQRLVDAVLHLADDAEEVEEAIAQFEDGLLAASIADENDPSRKLAAR